MSNLAGFFVLGGHGHSHGTEEGHEHQHGDQLRAAEEGHGDALEYRTADTDGQQDEHVGEIFPEAVVAKIQSRIQPTKGFTPADEDASTAKDSQTSLNRSFSKASSKSKQRRVSRGHARFSSLDEISIHPASFRQEIIAASKAQQLDGIDSEESNASEEEAVIDEEEALTETSPLLPRTNGKSNGDSEHHPYPSQAHSHPRSRSRGRGRRDSLHAGHNHNKPKKAAKAGHGHNHADMGMDAMILHVIGDALGNVGVIVSALIIWLSTWSGRFYADPAVSLFITLIILKSTVPLTSATAKILLQATPDHIDVTEIKEDIQAIPGVISCHHMHIWQLSDTQIVASMHVQVAFPISEAGGEKYMYLARAARKCLHAYGIHSATLQPEFCLDQNHDHVEGPSVGLDGVVNQERCGLDDDLCLLECVDDCKGKGCCSTPAQVESRHEHSSHNGHSH